ncbi:MAG: hypothetical protein D4S01_09540 [Dehalococcoidia bacterium]|nr:MAG: hypothetical protein D4S01_09540 [Dehalococcoidia bacterium]
MQPISKEDGESPLVMRDGQARPKEPSPCSCESGLKYKRCCGRKLQLAEAKRRDDDYQNKISY